jgi:hypothetical protein
MAAACRVWSSKEMQVSKDNKNIKTFGTTSCGTIIGSLFASSLSSITT